MGKYYRPEVRDAAPGSRSPDTFDSYWMIRDSVERKTGLIYGRLHDGVGGSCAIGAFWDDNPNLSLKHCIIEEVAAYNDSIPKSDTPLMRRNKVLRWLSAKLRWLEVPVRSVPKPRKRTPKPKRSAA